MKKFATTLLLGALVGGFSSTASADNYNNNCCPPPPCAPSCCNDWSFADGKFSAGADWLYWNVSEGGLEFGTLSEGPDNDYTNRALRPGSNYQNGVRAYVGYELPSKGWELTVGYVYLPGDASTSFDDVTGNFYPSDNAGVLAGETIDLVTADLHAKWTSNLNIIDVDVARTLSFGECFHLVPHAGFRTILLDQKYRVNFEGTSSDDYTEFHLKSDFTGYGVEGGLLADWNIAQGFSLLGHVGGSILYSTNHVHQSQLGSDSNFTGTYHNKVTSATPTMDYFLGLRYVDTFCDFDVSAIIGWESHVLFDVNHLTGSGNYGAQGLTLGLGVDF